MDDIANSTFDEPKTLYKYYPGKLESLLSASFEILKTKLTAQVEQFGK